MRNTLAAFIILGSIAAFGWEARLPNVKEVIVNPGGGGGTVKYKNNGEAFRLVASNETGFVYQDGTGCVWQVIGPGTEKGDWLMTLGTTPSEPVLMTYTNSHPLVTTGSGSNIWVCATNQNIVLHYDEHNPQPEWEAIIPGENIGLSPYPARMTDNVVSNNVVIFATHCEAHRVIPVGVAYTNLIDRVFYESQTNSLVITEVDPTATAKANAAIVSAMCVRTNKVGQIDSGVTSISLQREGSTYVSVDSYGVNYKGNDNETIQLAYDTTSPRGDARLSVFDGISARMRRLAYSDEITGGGGSFNPTNTAFEESISVNYYNGNFNNLYIYPGYLTYSFYLPSGSTSSPSWSSSVYLPPQNGTDEDVDQITDSVSGTTKDILATRYWAKNNVGKDPLVMHYYSFSDTPTVEELAGILKQIITDLGGTYGN